jgi:tyrosine-protein phosphatase SIW14
MSNSDSDSEFLAAGMALAYMSVPDAYGVVEAGVYRSKALELHNLPFLLHLQLRTVLYLSNDSLVRPVIDFLNNHNIKLVWLDPSNC